jgi:hypothetical protein
MPDNAERLLNGDNLPECQNLIFMPQGYRLPPTFSLLYTLGHQVFYIKRMKYGALYINEFRMLSFFSFPSFLLGIRKSPAAMRGFFLIPAKAGIS